MLEFPTAGAPYDWPTNTSDGVAVSNLRKLSWYDGTQAKPRWSQSNPHTGELDTLAIVSPGPFVPAIAAGKVFVRWSTQTLKMKVQVQPRSGAPPTVEAIINLPVNIAAFSTRTGVQLWSTASQPDCKLCPACDPVAADGRLYLLATSRTHEFSPIYLVCLWPITGR